MRSEADETCLGVLRDRVKAGRNEPDATTGVRRLLCELRPDRDGPFGWGPDAAPPDGTEPTLGALAARIRVQSSVVVPAILPTAFESAARPTRGAAIARLLAEEVERAAQASLMAAPECEGVRAFERGLRACAWLQRHGTLQRGAEAMYVALAMALAEPSRRQRWANGTAGAWRGAVVWGSARCIEAVAAWESVGRVG